jgi:uncharacterized protein
VLTKSDILETLRAKRPELESRFKVQTIGIFGSYACDEQTDESDIDVLVEFSEPVGWEFFELQDWLHELFGKRIDLVTRRALKPLIKDQILADLLSS